MTLYCFVCESEITFNDEFISTGGKLIPLDADTLQFQMPFVKTSIEYL